MPVVTPAKGVGCRREKIEVHIPPAHLLSVRPQRRLTTRVGDDYFNSGALGWREWVLHRSHRDNQRGSLSLRRCAFRCSLERDEQQRSDRNGRAKSDLQASHAYLLRSQRPYIAALGHFVPLLSDNTTRGSLSAPPPPAVTRSCG